MPLSFFWFLAIWNNPEAQLQTHGLCKTCIFINSNLLSYKTWKKNYKIFNTVLILVLWVKVLLFTKRCCFFAIIKKKCWHQQNLESLATKRYLFLKLNMCVYLRNLRTKFQVSSIILTSFRQGGFYPHPPQNKPLKSPPRLGLSFVFFSFRT